jgi:hypothetical protein
MFCCLILGDVHLTKLSAQGSKENTHEEQVPQVEEKIFTDEDLNTLIDPILTSDDLNKDGFIDYPGMTPWRTFFITVLFKKSSSRIYSSATEISSS